jgi:glycine betaine catabolism B
MSRWIADMVFPSEIVFFHCARTPHDIIFRQELDMMSARLPNFRLAISTTRSELGQPWAGFTGRLTPILLQAIAPDFHDRTVYVCGPNGFMKEVKTLLEGLNFPMQNYYEESFGAPKKAKPSTAQPTPARPTPESPSPIASISSSASASPPSSSIPGQPVVLFTQSGKEVQSDGSESLLDLAEQEGIKIRSNCRQGACGACKKKKLEGEVTYEAEPDGLDESDRQAGYVLTCTAFPVGRVLIEA